MLRVLLSFVVVSAAGFDVAGRALPSFFAVFALLSLIWGVIKFIIAQAAGGIISGKAWEIWQKHSPPGESEKVVLPASEVKSLIQSVDIATQLSKSLREENCRLRAEIDRFQAIKNLHRHPVTFEGTTDTDQLSMQDLFRPQSCRDIN